MDVEMTAGNRRFGSRSSSFLVQLVALKVSVWLCETAQIPS
jgi:hypothetical protein